MHDVLERTYLHAGSGEQALASHALERINTCAYAYAERLHAMCLNGSVNAYEHTLSFWYLVVYTEQRGRPGWITIPATPIEDRLRCDPPKALRMEPSHHCPPQSKPQGSTDRR